METADGDPPVTTVVISHNRKDDLTRSLPRQTAPTILVDNGSTDGTAPMVREAFPDVRLLRLPGNHGAVARNVGVAAADTPYVAFADDDSWWAPGALLDAATLLGRHPQLGLVAGRILLGEDGREDPMCATLAASPLPGRPDLPGTPILGFACCGAVVRRTAFLDAGGFDPVVSFPGEEARLALDLAMGGWELRYVPDLVAHHHPSPRRDRRKRRRSLARSALLTQVMRRPWPVTVRHAWRAARSGTDGLRGVLAAVPRLPAALTERRCVPPHIEARLRLLER